MAGRNQAILLPEVLWAHFDGERKSVHCKSPYYTAWNRLIQGSVAGMIRKAMMNLAPCLAGIGGRMLLQVHDSILLLVPTHRMLHALPMIREAMEDFPEWDIPARVDIKAGPNWLDVKEAA